MTSDKSQIREEVRLLEKCQWDIIDDLKKFLNSRKRYNVSTCAGGFSENTFFCKSATINETARLLTDYNNRIATLRRYEEKENKS